MKEHTTRFGEVEVPEDAVVTFPSGILGFDELKQYVMLKTTELGLFRWLQSTEIPALAFVVCDPCLIVPEYKVEVRADEVAEIGTSQAAKAEVMVILTHPHDRRQMTANLQGPIIYNRARRLAKQVVLPGDTYSCRHRVFPDEAVQTAHVGLNQDVA